MAPNAVLSRQGAGAPQTRFVSITILASVVIGRDDARVLCRTGALPEIVQSDGKQSTIRPTYAAWMLHIYVCESGWLGLGEEVSFVA